MGLDVKRNDLTVGIIGAGAMGRGIAQIAALSGVQVLLADARPETVSDATSFIDKMLDRQVEKGKLDRVEKQASVDRIRPVAAGPDNGYAAFAPAHTVIEAVIENMEVKQAVLKGLEDSVTEDCIIATNTSSLSVTAFAAAAARPQRVAGFHFFNPVPLMRIVEVIPGLLTEDWVTDALTDLAHRIGHHPVVASDTPGFLVNHAGRGYGTEALRIVGEGIAQPADIDRIMTQTAGFRMGPFELVDLTGLDVSHTVMESIYRQFYDEPRYRPSVITGQRFAAGLFGRKTGRGFYSYDGGKKEEPAEPPAPSTDPAAQPVWISRQEPAADTLVACAESTGASVERGDRPSPAALCLVTPFGSDATTAALAQNLNPQHTVAVDLLFGLTGRRSLMTTPITKPDYRDQAHALLAADGSSVTAIHDSPGFVAQRIIAAIVNIGCDIAQQGIAAPADVNRAVELGLGYPKGPLAWGDSLGPALILRILEAMHAFYGDPRYRPSPWLKRRALLGVPLTTIEA